MPAAVPVLLCLTTCPDPATARRIADALVEEGLAACVNVLGPVESVYRWQGAIERAGEVQLLIKTTGARFDALQARLAALHPYDVPELLAFRAERGAPDYLAWIAAQTGEAS